MFGFGTREIPSGGPRERLFADNPQQFPEVHAQAVLKHLSALSEAGLLGRERAGREVRYRVTPAPLSEAVSWMADVGGEWDARLAALKRQFRPVGE